VTAQLNIKHLFIGGIIPGLVLVFALSVTGVIISLKNKSTEKFRFDGKEAGKALMNSLGELLLPVVIITLFFTGVTTLVETASVAVVYTIILEVVIKKDLRLRDLFKVFQRCLPIIGGVLVILAMAKGLSNYIVDAEVPMFLTTFFQEKIQSPVVFLLLLNLILLITGCLMDIYSAILVVAPLIIPLGALYGIHPVQLGIIFLANLELGYLTPPVGLNLFLASYSFKTPLLKIYKSVWPFFLILLAMILLITFVPWLSTALLK
jgi:tripartite ATP-independent transporter DctM subunit